MAFKPGRYRACGGYVGMTLWPDGTAEDGEYADLAPGVGGWASGAGRWAADEGVATVTIAYNAGNRQNTSYPYTLKFRATDDGALAPVEAGARHTYQWDGDADEAKRPPPAEQVTNFDAAAVHRARMARLGESSDRGRDSSRGRGRGRGGAPADNAGGRGGGALARGRGGAPAAPTKPDAAEDSDA